MGKRPLYGQIHDDLKQSILDGRLLPDQKLPTEFELAKQYGVSRITSKRALTELETEGFIYRQQGRGSFVRMRPIPIISDKILFVLPFSDDPSFGNYAMGISYALNESSYQMVIISNESFSQMTLESLQSEYAGMVYYPTEVLSELDRLFQLQLAHFPVVIMDKPLEGLQLPTVQADNSQGGYLATQYLIKLGHKRILFYGSQPANSPLIPSVIQRYLGYVDALNEANIQPLNTLTSFRTLTDFSLDELQQYIVNQQISAMVCENDIIAIRLMNGLQSRGIKVPETLSIIGFDNLSVTELSFPALTTIAQDFPAEGRMATNILLEQIKSRSISSAIHQLPVTLVKRQSTQKRSVE